MSGTGGQADGRAARLGQGLDRADEGLGRRRGVGAEHRGEQAQAEIAVAVHHPLGHARRAAGVEHVDVVFGVVLARQGIVRRDQVLQAMGAGQMQARAVVDLDEEFQLGQVLQDA